MKKNESMISYLKLGQEPDRRRSDLQKDEDGTAFDIDFLVAQKADGYRVLQAVIHSVGGEKREYHLEN